jgi:hypothetical protein
MASQATLDREIVSTHQIPKRRLELFKALSIFMLCKILHELHYSLQPIPNYFYFIYELISSDNAVRVLDAFINRPH